MKKVFLAFIASFFMFATTLVANEIIVGYYSTKSYEKFLAEEICSKVSDLFLIDKCAIFDSINKQTDLNNGFITHAITSDIEGNFKDISVIREYSDIGLVILSNNKIDSNKQSDIFKLLENSKVSISKKDYEMLDFYEIDFDVPGVNFVIEENDIDVADSVKSHKSTFGLSFQFLHPDTKFFKKVTDEDIEYKGFILNDLYKNVEKSKIVSAITRNARLRASFSLDKHKHIVTTTSTLPVYIIGLPSDTDIRKLSYTEKGMSYVLGWIDLKNILPQSDKTTKIAAWTEDKLKESMPYLEKAANITKDVTQKVVDTSVETYKEITKK